MAQGKRRDATTVLVGPDLAGAGYLSSLKAEVGLQNCAIISTGTLRLELTPEAAEVLIASDLLSAQARPVTVRAIYFDTPSRDLSAAGFTLQIREAEGAWVQIVEASAAPAGLFALPEWRHRIKGEGPVIDDSTPLRAVLGSRAHHLTPAFQLELARQEWQLQSDGAEVVLTLERGEIMAGDRRAPICELVLTIGHGPASALYSLARRLDELAPLRLGVVSEAERGFRLIDPLPLTHKAGQVALNDDMTAADSFRLIVAACLRQFRLNEPLISPANPEALHQARVALRRLRSAFSLFRPMLGDDQLTRLSEESQWLAAVLGEARDIDVLQARCTTEDQRQRLQPARRTAYDRAEAMLASRRARILMPDLVEYAALGPWCTLPSAAEVRQTPIREFAGAALDRYRRKVKKDGADLSELGDAALHEIRKDAKKLRYGAEFFVPLFRDKRRRRAARFVAALAELQDQLGALNDLATASATLARIGLADDPALIRLTGSDKERRALIKAVAEAHEAFVDARRFWR